MTGGTPAGGSLRLELKGAVEKYLAPDPEHDEAWAAYQLRLEQWEKVGRFLEYDPPEEPERAGRGEMPTALALYLQCRRWNCMLRAGGLQDQPAWTFDLVDLAGAVYERVMAESGSRPL